MSKPTPTSETLTRRGAAALAERIQAYWHGQGHESVKVWIEPVSQERLNPALMNTKANAYVVRSNLVNGSPEA